MLTDLSDPKSLVSPAPGLLEGSQAPLCGLSPQSLLIQHLMSQEATTFKRATDLNLPSPCQGKLTLIPFMTLAFKLIHY